MVFNNVNYTQQLKVIFENVYKIPFEIIIFLFFYAVLLNQCCCVSIQKITYHCSLYLSNEPNYRSKDDELHFNVSLLLEIGFLIYKIPLYASTQ